MWRDQELSNPDRKQDFDYEKLELSKIQNNIIEQLEKVRVKIDHIEDEEMIPAVNNLEKKETS